MPAPYTLFEMPAGNKSDIFDFQAIHMTVAHNLFISGFNAMAAHAAYITDDQVQPFMVFCLAMFGGVHHHHGLEETYYFPALEEKLGKGALSQNMEEHETFIPALEETESWLQDVKNGKAKYDGKLFLQKLDSFSDPMFEHMSHEPATIASSRLRKALTKAEITAIDKELTKRALSGLDLYTSLPIALVNIDPANPWFPPIPWILKVATRWWFARRYRKSWEFGATDFSGNPKVLPVRPETKLQESLS